MSPTGSFDEADLYQALSPFGRRSLVSVNVVPCDSRRQLSANWAMSKLGVGMMDFLIIDWGMISRLGCDANRLRVRRLLNNR